LAAVTTTTTTTTTTSSNLYVVEAFQSTVFSSRPSSGSCRRQDRYNSNSNYNKCGRIRRNQQQQQQQQLSLFSLPSKTIPPISRSSQSQSQLFALVYGTDGNVVKDVDDDDTGVDVDDGDDVEQQQHAFLLESLQNYDNNNIFWAKIACAFAPPPHDRLTPNLIKDATLIKVGKTNFDIAIAVPASGGDQLVQILVTVGYPKSIFAFEDDNNNNEGRNNNIMNSEEKLSALIQQVRILDGHATDRLVSRSKQDSVSMDDEHYYERIVIEKNWLERLQNEEPQPSNRPDWWTTIELPKSSLELVDECKSLKDLLNEDEFEDELRSLFVQNYNIDHQVGGGGGDDDDGRDYRSSNNILVLRAAVSSIGSSGMFLQARAVVINNENGGSHDEIILAAAVPYESNPALRKEFHTIDDVREGVLTLVESVAPMPKPTIPLPLSLSSGGTTTVDSTADTTFTPFNEQVMKSVNTADADADAAADAGTLVEDNGETDSSTIPIQTSSLDEKDDDDDEEPSQDVAVAVTADTNDNDITADVATTKAEGDVEEDKEAVTSTTVESSASASAVNDIDKARRRRQQPKSPEEEAKLAAKYGAIEDLGERAYTILLDLDMV
jgi:hypothetical protein